MAETSLTVEARAAAAAWALALAAPAAEAAASPTHACARHDGSPSDAALVYSVQRALRQGGAAMSPNKQVLVYLRTLTTFSSRSRRHTCAGCGVSGSPGDAFGAVGPHRACDRRCGTRCGPGCSCDSGLQAHGS